VADAKVVHRLLLLLILIGLAFSLYATLETLDPALQATCTVNSYLSCQAVDSSSFTHTGPIPDWAIGVGGFLLLLLLDLALLRTYEARWLNAVTVVAALGVVTAIYLGSIELFLIKAICPICLGAYLSGVAVLLVAIWLRRIRASAEPEHAPSRASGETA
jgi:uncharacterized membrane protein